MSGWCPLDKLGRPTKYKEEYCQQIIDFFDRPLFEEKEVSSFEKGRTVIRKISVPCLLPTIERFCLNIGIHKDTLYEWVKVHPDFSDSLRRAQQAQQEILVQHGLTGLYKEGFAKFVGVNYTNLKDKVEQVHSVSEIKLAYKDD